MWLLLHACTESRRANFAVFWVNLSGISPSFYSPRWLCFTAMYRIFSSPWLAIIHGIVQCCLASTPCTGLLSFAIFSVTSACLSVVILIIILFFLLQCNLILKTLDQPPLSFVTVCWQQTEMSFLFFRPVKKGWHSSTPPLGLPRDSPPLPHSLYGRTFVRTVTS